MNIFRPRRKDENTSAHEVYKEHGGQEETKIQSLDHLAMWVILGMLFLLPIAFLPIISVPFQFTKIALAFYGILIALILFLVARLKVGRLSIPYNRIVFAVWLLPIAYFFSGIFSKNPRLSFIGEGFEVDTWSFVALMALFVTLVVMLMRTREQVLYSYLVLFISFILLWVFQGLRLLFGPDFLSFDVLTAITSNILGKWNDLAVFFGLATILTLVTLVSLELDALYKRILYVMLVISLFFLMVVNFRLVWIVVGIFALGFSLHSVGISQFNWRKALPMKLREGKDMGSTEQKVSTPLSTISLPGVFVLIITLVFIFGGSTVGNYIAAQFNISQVEARPSWQTTVNIGRVTLERNLFFGSGPNTFVRQWALYKPVEVNSSVFWNADFLSGIGTIPTSLITTGLIGIIAWVTFFIFYIYGGLRVLLFTPVDNRFTYYISLASFLGGLYLWVMAVFYIPNPVLIVLAFFFTGIFVASLRHHPDAFKEKTLEFAGNPKTGFVSVLMLTFLLFVAIVGMYSVGKQYVASAYFQKAILALNREGNLDTAEAHFENALKLSESDRFYRGLAEVHLNRLIVLQSRTDLSPQELRSEFQSILSNAIENGQRAVNTDSGNYQNWIILGRVYAQVVPLGIAGAYENAKQTFARAEELYPNNPLIQLLFARLEVAHSDTGRAREYIARARTLKGNYTDAIYLLSQIEVAHGNIPAAIVSVEDAAVIAPNNPVIFFQLGLLYYNQGEFAKSIAAFERAIALNTSYANARYFLGLSYDRVRRSQEAIAQFEEIERSNPNNEEVKLILNNLRNGRDPFANIVPPPSPPEGRDTLPIQEEIESETLEQGAVESSGSGESGGLIAE